MSDNLPATVEDAPLAATSAPPRDVTIGVGPRGLNLQTFDDMWRFANAICRAQWAPKGSTPDGCLVAMQYGAELGMGPMQSIQNISVVNGRPAVWGDALLGICKASPAFDHGAFREWYTGTPYEDDYTAHTQVNRSGNGEAIVSSYSVAKAKKAKLWGKSGPWTTDTDRMLKYRARAFACRDCFPDVLKGLHAGEEMASDMGFSGVEQRPPEPDTTGSRTERLAASVTASLPEPPPPEPVQATEKPPTATKDKNAAPTSPDHLASLRETVRENYKGLAMDNKGRFLKNFGLEVIDDIAKVDKGQDLVDMIAELKGM